MGLMSRMKGKRGEREVAKRLRRIYGDGIRRGNQSRRGDDEPDIVGCPTWLHVEVKYQARTDLKNWWSKACSEAPQPVEVVAVYWRRTGERHWKVTMSLSCLSSLRQLVQDNLNDEAHSDPPSGWFWHAQRLVTLQAEDFEAILEEIHTPTTRAPPCTTT